MVGNKPVSRPGIRETVHLQARFDLYKDNPVSCLWYVCDLLDAHGILPPKLGSYTTFLGILKKALNQINLVIDNCPNSPVHCHSELERPVDSFRRTIRRILVAEAVQEAHLLSVSRHLGIPPDELRNILNQNDPTAPRLEYATWTLKQLKRAGVESIDDISRLLTKFHRAKTLKVLEGNEADINRYKSIRDLELAMERIPDSRIELSRTQRRGRSATFPELEDVSGWEVLAESRDYILIKTVNPSVCAVIARKTELCVKYADGAASNYLSHGPLYFFVGKESHATEYAVSMTSKYNIAGKELGTWDHFEIRDKDDGIPLAEDVPEDIVNGIWSILKSEDVIPREAEREFRQWAEDGESKLPQVVSDEFGVEWEVAEDGEVSTSADSMVVGVLSYHWTDWRLPILKFAEIYDVNRNLDVLETVSRIHLPDFEEYLLVSGPGYTEQDIARDIADLILFYKRPDLKESIQEAADKGRLLQDNENSETEFGNYDIISFDDLYENLHSKESSSLDEINIGLRKEEVLRLGAEKEAGQEDVDPETHYITYRAEGINIPLRYDAIKGVFIVQFHVSGQEAINKVQSDFYAGELEKLLGLIQYTE
jgi:hypothetical protein